MDGLARMASKIAAGLPMAGVVPASTSALVQGVRRMMLRDAMRRGIVGALAIGGAAVGIAIAAQAPVPAPAPARAAAGAAEEVQISHEVRFCDMGRRGPAWREAFAATPGFRFVASRPPYTAWALDPHTARLFLDHCQSAADANIVQAPKVTAFDGATASISTATPIEFDRAAGPYEARGGFIAADRGDPKAGTVREGMDVRVTGRKVAGGVRLKVDIDLAHVVAVHEAVLPGSAAVSARPGEAAGPRKVRLPEVERSRVEGEWTVGDGESLALSLGLLRTVDAAGQGALREMVVLLTPRLILTEAEEARILVPAVPARKP